MNHVNSNPRASLGGKSPIQMLRFVYGENDANALLEALGIEEKGRDEVLRLLCKVTSHKYSGGVSQQPTTARNTAEQLRSHRRLPRTNYSETITQRSLPHTHELQHSTVRINELPLTDCP